MARRKKMTTEKRELPRQDDDATPVGATWSVPPPPPPPPPPPAPTSVSPSPPTPPPPVRSKPEITRSTIVESVCAAVGNNSLAIAEDCADRLRIDVEDDVTSPKSFFDLRLEQDYRYTGGKSKVKMLGTRVQSRDPKTIDTIVIHQTGIEFGVSQRAIAAAGGDAQLAKARRALNVACHVMAFRAGYFVAAHSLTDYVNHAGRLNARSVGLEIEGRYPGLQDDPTTIAREDLTTTWGAAPSQLTDATVTAACLAINWLVERGRQGGMPLRKIVAHRQSSSGRRADPGQEIWRRVVLDFAVEELGLVTVPKQRWGDGRPIPVEWDPDGLEHY
jgi:hypothetical protein